MLSPVSDTLTAMSESRQASQGSGLSGGDPTGGEAGKGSGLPVERGAEEIRLRCYSPGAGVRELAREEFGAALAYGSCAVWINLLRPWEAARGILSGELGLGALADGPQAEECYGEWIARAALDSLVDGHLPALVGVATVAEGPEERLDPRNERVSTAALENLILLRRDLSAYRRLAIAQQESPRRLGRCSRRLCDHLSDVAD